MVSEEEGLTHADRSESGLEEWRVVGVEGIGSLEVVGPGAVSRHDLEVGQLE